MHEEETIKLKAAEEGHYLIDQEDPELVAEEPKLYLNSRQGFVRKVYLILCTQLCFTGFVVMMAVVHFPTKLFMLTHPAIAIICAVTAIVCMYALACYQSISRTVPTNYIFLAIFTLCEAYLV